MSQLRDEQRRFKREVEKDIRIKEASFLSFEYAKRHFQAHDPRYKDFSANKHIFLACCETLKNNNLVEVDIWDCDAYQDYLELDSVLWLAKNISSKIKLPELHNELYSTITRNCLYLILKEAIDIANEYEYPPTSLLKNNAVIPAIEQYIYFQQNFLLDVDKNKVNKSLIGYWNRSTRDGMPAVVIGSHLPEPPPRLSQLKRHISEEVGKAADHPDFDVTVLPNRRGGMHSRLIGLYLWDKKHNLMNTTVSQALNSFKKDIEDAMKMAASPHVGQGFFFFLNCPLERAENLYAVTEKCIQCNKILPISH